MGAHGDEGGNEAEIVRRLLERAEELVRELVVRSEGRLSAEDMRAVTQSLRLAGSIAGHLEQLMLREWSSADAGRTERASIPPVSTDAGRAPVSEAAGRSSWPGVLETTWVPSAEEEALVPAVVAMAAHIADKSLVEALGDSLTRQQVHPGVWLGLLNALDDDEATSQEAEDRRIPAAILRTLGQHGFQEHKIRVGSSLNRIPAAWVDEGRMQRVHDSSRDEGIILRLRRRCIAGPGFFQRAALVVSARHG